MFAKKQLTIITLALTLFSFFDTKNNTVFSSEVVRSEIVFLHTNDLHFDFNHLEHFEKIVNVFREQYEDVYLLDAGDIFVRHKHRWPEKTLAFYEKRTQFMINTMNKMGYDAAVLGNHELDLYDTITRDSLRLAEFPLLGANVEVDTDKFDDPAPYIVFETENSETIAVLGLTTGGSAGVSTTDHLETLEKHLHLIDKHDVFVLLTHIGAGSDRGIARQYGEIDVIIGGHSHTHLNPAEKINDVLVAQTGGQNHQIDPDREQHLGIIKMVLEKSEVVQKYGEVVTLDGSEEVLESVAAFAQIDIQINRLDEVEVYVTNRSSRDEKDFLVKLVVDDEEIGREHMQIGLWEQSSAAFDLPSALTGKHEIKATVVHKRNKESHRIKEYRTFDREKKEIPKIDFEPQIDGDLSEWKEWPFVLLESEDKDWRASLYSGWDKTNFYLAVSVEDENHYNEQDAGNIWDGDSLQFALDPMITGIQTFNLGLALASGKVQSHQWAGPDTDLFEQSDYVVVRDEDRGKTFYEIKIPFNVIKLDPDKDPIFGFNAVVFNDEDGEGFDHWVEMTPGIAGGWDPGEFKNFILTDGK